MAEHLFNLNNPVESFLTNLIDFCNEKRRPKVRDQTFILFELLCEVGFDFYSLLAIYSQIHSLTTNELERIVLYSPMPQAVMLPETKNIRKAIPRWTGAKYHTASIANVISEIRQKILSGNPGIYCYNSNLNPRNRKSLNDLYILIITPYSIYWYDINRKNTYQFSLDTGGINND